MTEKEVLVNVIVRTMYELANLYQDALSTSDRPGKEVMLADLSRHMANIMGVFMSGLNLYEEVNEQN